MDEDNSQLEHVINFQAPLGMTVSGGLSLDQNMAHGTELTNFFSYDGMLLPAWQYLSGYNVLISPEFNVKSTTNSNAQAVRKILTTTGGIACIVTTREIFVKDSAGVWQNATPTYTTGTARCLTSTTVTGTGTTWSAQKIQPGDLINFPTISSTWYMVSSVGGDTSITLTATGPNTVGYVTYTIRRVLQGNADLATGSGFGNGHKNEIHAIIFNQNLYVAGNNLGGGQPGIIKVTNCIAPSTVNPGTYILGYADLTGSMPAGAQISTITKIIGLQSDPSGRLMIACYEQSGGVPTYNRIRWNDLTNEDEWLTSPAGFNDLVGPSARGILTGLGKVGPSLSAHFSYGIVMGVPTGDDAVPYDWRDMPSSVGASSSTFLTQSHHGDVFMGSDGAVWEFTGEAPRRVAPQDDTFAAMFTTIGQYDNLSPFTRTNTNSLTCCAHDTVTNSFHLFVNWYYTSSLQVGCYHIQVQLDSGAFYAHEYPSPVSAMTTLPGQKRGIYLGGVTADQSGSGFADVADSFTVCAASLASYPANANFNMVVPVDLIQTNASSTMTTLFKTGWIDFGIPHWLKRVDEIEAWYIPTAASSPGNDTVQVDVESRPLNIYPSIQSTFPDVLTAGFSLPQYKLVAPKVQPLPVQVARFRWNEAGSSEQRKAGSHFRFSFTGFPGGICMLVFRATALGPISAVDS